MFQKKIAEQRWFIWTLAFLVAAGLSIVSYLQWVNTEMASENTLAASEITTQR